MRCHARQPAQRRPRPEFPRPWHRQHTRRRKERPDACHQRKDQGLLYACHHAPAGPYRQKILIERQRRSASKSCNWSCNKLESKQKKTSPTRLEHRTTWTQLLSTAVLQRHDDIYKTGQERQEEWDDLTPAFKDPS